MSSRRHPRVLVLLAAVACAGAFGCCKSGNPVAPLVTSALPDSVPFATTPANLLARFEAAYEFEAAAEYGLLVSDDFRFTFSADSDPGLVAIYGDRWRKVDEVASASHLFAGFTNGIGEYQAGATSIRLHAGVVSIVDDPGHADSAAHYRMAIVPDLEARIVTAGGEEFEIRGPQDLYLVRGDAAVLAGGQEARSDRWYLRRWVDRSAPLTVLDMQSSASSWGRWKAVYR